MRINTAMIDFFKIVCKTYLSNSDIYLFGSRTNDLLKGGDIDILIIGERKLHWQEKGKIRNAFYSEFGEQKLDIVSFTYSENDSFKNIALLTAVKL